jgi:hypothetical protein
MAERASDISKLAGCRDKPLPRLHVTADNPIKGCAARFHVASGRAPHYESGTAICWPSHGKMRHQDDAWSLTERSQQIEFRDWTIRIRLLINLIRRAHNMFLAESPKVSSNQPQKSERSTLIYGMNIKVIK